MTPKYQRWNIFNSFSIAFTGLFWALKREPNLWIQLGIGVFFSVLAISQKRLTAAGINFTMVCFILALEMINSAIETLCDLVDTNHNIQIKFIKDVSAGAVLIAAMGWALVIAYLVVTIFWPGLINFS